MPEAGLEVCPGAGALRSPVCAHAWIGGGEGEGGEHANRYHGGGGRRLGTVVEILNSCLYLFN